MLQNYYPFGWGMPGKQNGNSYRYGFNGEEKDNEIKGEGNSYNYGSRIYDPRLGRWSSLDPISIKFPCESNYSYTSNNPILFIDVDGKYKYPKNLIKEYSKWYPLLNKYLAENVKQDVMNSPTLKTAFLKYSGGNLTTESLSKATTWNEGPSIIIRDDPGGMQGANGYYDSGTGTIQISTKLAKQLENAKPEDKQAALYGLFETLLHETTHYGDYLDGIRQDRDDPSGFGGEPGTALSNDVFYTKTVTVDNEKYQVLEVGLDHTNIEDAKKIMEMNKYDGKGDIIPTVPTQANEEKANPPSNQPTKNHKK